MLRVSNAQTFTSVCTKDSAEAPFISISLCGMTHEHAIAAENLSPVS